jgi:hypothetical protein
VATSQGLAKPYLLGVISILAVLTAVFVESNLNPPQETSETPTRKSAIPAGEVKMTPAADINPSILHADEWSRTVPLADAVNAAGEMVEADIVAYKKIIHKPFDAGS